MSCRVRFYKLEHRGAPSHTLFITLYFDEKQELFLAELTEAETNASLSICLPKCGVKIGHFI